VTALTKFLKDHRKSIIKRWFDLTSSTYPKETKRFLSKEKDPFANPVGFTLRDGTESIFDAVVDDVKDDELSTIVDGCIRIRAVQDFSPSKSVGFIFLLKQAIREQAQKEKVYESLLSEMPTIDTKVDRVALLAFDIYAKCKKTLFTMRVNEIKQNVVRNFKHEGKWPKDLPSDENMLLPLKDENTN